MFSLDCLYRVYAGLVVYRENILYGEEVVEVSYRGGCFEFNHVANSVRCVRVFDRGCLGVASSSTLSFDELYGIAVKSTRVCREKTMWFHEDFYSGSVSIGVDRGWDLLYDLIRGVVDYFSGRGVGCEVIGVYKRVSRRHDVVSHGVSASEERVLYELYIYPYTLFYGRILSTGLLIGSSNPSILANTVEEGLDDLYGQLVSQARARQLNPVYTGRWHIVLTGISAPILYHELAHLLQSTSLKKLPIGYRVKEGLTMVENPYYPGPLQRLFDDEIYPGWKRVLVEDGVVVDYLRSRTSVDGESKPGNGRGLFTRPLPLYHQLIVSRGDWSFDEMLFESRRSIVVSNVVEARLYGGYIRIIPETAWVAEKDRLQPVRVNEILIPLDKLGEVFIGFGKRLYSRYGFEKSFEVYEVAPETLVEARVSI